MIDRIQKNESYTSIQDEDLAVEIANSEGIENPSVVSSLCIAMILAGFDGLTIKSDYVGV